MFRIVFADDHPIVRAGIRSELLRHSSDFEIVGEAVNGDEALIMSKSLQPDALILDINMPGMKAIDVIKEIKREPFTCHILILTIYSDKATILGLLKAGADGYLLKDEDPSTISDAIRAVGRGETWLSQSVSQQIISFVKETPEAPLGGALTKREREILNYLSDGRKNKDIALTLHTSERTVEFHISNILSKMGVKNRWEAVTWAKEHNLI